MNGRYRWGHHIRSYRWRSIFLKYFTMLFASLLVFIIVLNVVYYIFYNDTLRDEAFSANENLLEKAAGFMDFALRNAENLSANLILDYEAEYFLNARSGDRSREYLNQYHLNQKMTGLVTTGDYYTSLFLYSESRDEVLDTAYGLSSRLDFYDTDWYAHYQRHPFSPFAFSRVVDVKPLKIYERLLTYIIPFNIGTTARSGAVVVNYNMDRLKRMIDTTAGQADSLFIVDEAGILLYDTDLAHLGKAASEVEALSAYLLASGDALPSFAYDAEDGQRLICSSYVSAKNGWRYISVVPFALFGAMADQLRAVVLLTLLSGGVAAALIAFLMAVRVYAPIKTIIAILDEADTPWSRGVSAQNEIKLIVENLMNMLDSRRNLEDELTRRLLMLRKAQSVALQTQINPHFLFNTLESINWKAIRLTQGDNEVSRMIGLLSHILAYSLETEENLVSLETELTYTERYIMIQRERHKHRFDVEWRVDPSLHGMPVIKLMFQPLVENAMYHGILPKKEKGTIRIAVARVDGMLRAEVWDNGQGMPAQQVEALNRELRDGSVFRESQHIGLGNVNQRIRVVYGDAYGLTVESKAGAYTRIALNLPIGQNNAPKSNIGHLPGTEHV